MTTSEYPPVEAVRESLRYEEGKLYWLMRPRHHFPGERTWGMWNSRFCGKEAGRKTLDRRHGRWHWEAGLFGRRIRRHHLVWALINGEWPSSDLGYENGNSLDDHIENLRPSTRRHR
jgi:hypothetical protein